MSMAPRGPLPARVYWVRRGILIGVALLLVLVIGKLLTGGSDGSEKPKADAGKAALVGGRTSTSATPTGTPTDVVTPSNGKGLPLAEPSGPCDPENVTITPSGGKRPNDGRVEMPLVVSTTEEACTFAFSPQSVAVKITSGADSIWSTQQCDVLPTADLVVRAVKPARVTFVWNGHRADDTCSRAADWAGIGSYHAIAATLGGEPTDTQFELTGPPEVVVTKTAKPKPTPTPTASATASGTTTKASTQGGDPRQP
ncbi:hypothetical protein GCM10011584_23830 [Nocardioides phosphati]|uniref:DUF4232 domain-containing protein n=1 Tax=Nocardioides phosphati TaxID=1867775 RepID=A0ABQ2NAS8_9ACTN|nr:hypothetical protein [Nocardioides phosphati]GGO90920.1 hypothetical protein GCM10011584_23830 [Nocardioides phosphati]